MPRTNARWLVFALFSASLAGCETEPTALAPGADKVRITNSPSDVANCKAVGNLRVAPTPAQNDVALIRNQTIGFGGNTAFLTTGSGIAYQCP